MIDENVFTDMPDAGWNYSLFCYGIVRDPKSGLVVYSRQRLKTESRDPESTDPDDYLWDWTIVELEDVIEALLEINEGYFDFIGEPKVKVLARLDKDHLSSEIMSINSYGGHFEESCTWDHVPEIDPETKFLRKRGWDE